MKTECSVSYFHDEFDRVKLLFSLQMDFDVQDGVEHSTGTLQSFTNLLKNSAKKIQIIAKGLRLDNASGNRTVTDTAEGTRRSTEGTIQNTLVGYMNSTSSYLYRDHSEEDINSQMVSWKGDSYDLNNAFQWGAVQRNSGRDYVAGKDALSGIENDRILLTVLGANRDANGKNAQGRSTVSTGDEKFSGLWASLFGISLLSLAGYAMLRKKEL